MSKAFYWLGQLAPDDQDFVGDRAWQLHDLQQRGYPSLPGFVIPSCVFQDLLGAMELSTIGQTISDGISDPRQLQSLAQRCRQHILNASLKDVWQTELQSALQQLSQQQVSQQQVSQQQVSQSSIEGTASQPISTSASEHRVPASVPPQQLWLRSSIARTCSVRAQAEEDLFPFQVVQCDGSLSSLLRPLKELWSEAFRARNLLYWHAREDDLRALPLSVVVQALPSIAAYGTLDLRSSQGLILLRDPTLDPRLDGVVEEFSINLKPQSLLGLSSADPEPCTLSPSQLHSTIDLGLRLQREWGDNLRLDLLWGMPSPSHLPSHFPGQMDPQWIVDVRSGFATVANGAASDFPVCSLSTALASSIEPPIIDLVSTPQASVDQVRPATPIRLPIKLMGITTGQQRCRGPAVVITQDVLPVDIPPGSIIVTAKLQPSWVPQLNHAIAFVTEEGSLTSHGAILAREIGIPIVVNVPRASQVFRTGDWLCIEDQQVYQIDRPEGIDKRDEPPFSPSPLFVDPALYPLRYPVTATQLFVSLSQGDGLDEIAALPIDGIGLVRSELMLASWLRDTSLPNLMAQADLQALHNLMVDRLTAFTKALGDRPLFYRTLDYRREALESVFTAHGTLGYQLFPDWFDLELRAIDQVCRQSAAPFRLVLPFVRTVEEFRACRQKISALGLLQLPQVELWMMAEVPSVLFALESFIEAGVQGLLMGTGDLHQLLFAIDRDDVYLNQFYPLHHPVMLKVMTDLLHVTNQKQVPTILCLHSYQPDEILMETAIAHGIRGVSINPDALAVTWRTIARIEKRLLLHPHPTQSSP
ncbi:putative PEP-binding protein [Alkalinema pantanalense CENA528]|uniref:putative PEP-binding protein n=1 Tax=Alkalinema pantanalense TaxID=1620705 RepID=UPI003D6E6DAD